MSTYNNSSEGSLAERLFFKHLSYFTDTEMSIAEYAKIFTEDAVQEYPYAPAPYATAVNGNAAISEYITNVVKGANDWAFSNFKFFPTADPNTVFVEFEGSAMVISTGKPYKQIYVGRLKLKGEQIASYREYWNPSAILEAFI